MSERTLEQLFKDWKKKHAEEVKIIRDKLCVREGESVSKEKFQEQIYKKKGNTISSHFVQFFEKQNCRACEKGKEIQPWEIALANAFNMDGTYGDYEVKDGGYNYICLLKEANDSKKICIEDYTSKADKVNQWIVEERANKCCGKYKANMLDKLNNAFAKFLDKEVCSDFDFTKEMAYMNVNKRGGTSITAGRDETAVINYAERYRTLILQEIEILSKDKVRVFVCGSESYFNRLMKKLLKEKNVKVDNGIVQYEKIEFVRIPHPSSWVSSEKIAEEMAKGMIIK